MKIFREAAKLQNWCLKRKRQGAKIALVPTMGYLHEGHLSLMAEAKRRRADEIVASIFVNPVQFGPGEDFEKYPRDEKTDLMKCLKAGVTAVFLPQASAMYAPDHSTYVEETKLSQGLCGARRPGHFRGVATVVAKLFNLTQPDLAVFGQKDYQQAQVIKRMVRDLNFPVKIAVAPIVREKSGLALSSRNTYLGAEERESALALSKAVRSVKPGVSAAKERSRIAKELEKSGLKVDYIEFVDGETLDPVSKTAKGTCVLAAVFAGKTRLIDNNIVS